MQVWICPKGHKVSTPIPAQAVSCGVCNSTPSTRNNQNLMTLRSSAKEKADA